MKAGLDRRDMLKLLGLSAAFLPSLQSSTASARRAPESDLPAEQRIQRLLVLFTSQGTHRPFWKMAPAGQPDEQRFEFDLVGLGADAFSRCLEPLHAVRQHLLLLDGLSLGMVAVYGKEAHHTGHAVALSGAKPTLERDHVTSVSAPSIDQLVAAAHLDPGPLASLHYGKTFRPVSHDRRGAPIPSETNPFSAFARLFPGSAQGTDEGVSDAILAARGSVLDVVVRQTARLQTRLSGVDRLKLDEHQTHVRELERRLQQLRALNCGPASPPEVEPADPEAWIDWHASAWTDLALLALTCGSSRVVTLYDPGPSCAYLKLPGENLHAEYAHSVGMFPESDTAMVAHYRYYAARLGQIIERLASTPDGDGTLLDSTLVVQASELGSPNHDWTHYPQVLAGGARHFRLGRYVHYPPEREVKGRIQSGRMGPAHNRALVSIVRAFGVDTDAVGERTLPGADGADIDLTRPLDGLT